MVLKNNNPEWGFGTKAVHAGQRPDPVTGAVTIPIYQASTYQQDAVEEDRGYEYRVQVIPHAKRWDSCCGSEELNLVGHLPAEMACRRHYSAPTYAR